MLWVLTGVLMQVMFLLTAKELKTARKAYSKRVHSLLRKAQPWLNLATPFVMVLILLLDWLPFFRHPHRTPDTFGLVLTPVWLVLAAVGWWKWRHQRDFDPDYTQEQTLELQEDGLFRGTREATQLRVGWTKISRYVETDEFFLLSSPWPWGVEKPEKPSVVRKQGRYALFILPKRAFNSCDIERLRDLLQRKLSVWAKNPGGLRADTVLTA